MNVCINYKCYILIDLTFLQELFLNKATTLREEIICHYHYFLEINFRIQSKVCNMCHDMLIMSVHLNNIAILNICGVDYWCIIN